MLLRKITKSLIYSGLRLAPDYMLDKAAYGNMWARIRHLRETGFNPSQIVDVGAYDGLWATRAASVFPDAHILMIEPLEDKADKLREVEKKLGATFYQGLVAAESGKEFVFHQNETDSSIYNNDNPSKVDTKLISTTLDKVLSESGIEKIDLLKIDVQGAELDVLIGGEKALESTDVAILELSMDNSYYDAPHAGEIIAFMRGHGFTLRDVADVKRLRRGDAVHQFDGFFVRNELNNLVNSQ